MSDKSTQAPNDENERVLAGGECHVEAIGLNQTEDVSGAIEVLDSDHSSVRIFGKIGVDDGLRNPTATALIVKVESEHIPALKRLTSTLLPIRYPETFFTEVVVDSVSADLSRVVVNNAKPVGWIRCRLDHDYRHTSSSCHQEIYNQIYIQALCLLGPYRGQGLATRLLDSVCDYGLLDQYAVQNVFAHVWEHNEEALEWYEKRGFRRIMMVDNYYRRLRPAGAWIVRRDLR